MTAVPGASAMGLMLLPPELLGLVLDELEQPELVQTVHLCRALYTVIIPCLYRAPSIVGRQGHKRFFRTIFWDRRHDRLWHFVLALRWSRVKEYFDHVGSCTVGSHVRFPRCKSLSLSDVYAKDLLDDEREEFYVKRVMYYVGGTFPAIVELSIDGLPGLNDLFDDENAREEEFADPDAWAARCTAGGGAQWNLPRTPQLQLVRFRNQNFDDLDCQMDCLANVIGYFNSEPSLLSLDIQIHGAEFTDGDTLGIAYGRRDLQHLRLGGKTGFPIWDQDTAKVSFHRWFPSLRSLDLDFDYFTANPLDGRYEELKRVKITQKYRTQAEWRALTTHDRIAALEFTLRAARKGFLPALEHLHLAWTLPPDSDLQHAKERALRQVSHCGLLLELEDWAGANGVHWETSVR